MSHPNNLVPALPFSSSFTIKEASEILAEAAVIGRRLREKTALLEGAQPYVDAIKGYGNQAAQFAGDTMKNIATPPDNTWEAVRNGLIGSGIGAGVGGLASLGQPRGRRRSLSTMLQGAMLGGAIGGGGTLALQQANIVGKTPDSAVPSRIEALKADLKRNIARGTDSGNAAIQDEITSLSDRMATIPAPAAVEPAPAKPQPSVSQRLDSAITDINAGEPGNAAQTMFPHPGKAVTDAVGGGSLGYGIGAGVDHGIARATRGNMLNDIPLTQYKSQLGDALGEAAKRDMAAAPLRAGIRSIPASVKPHVTNLLATDAAKARPPGKFFRRSGGLAGAVIGSQLRQRPAE
jgi:hypothetical protein